MHNGERVQALIQEYNLQLHSWQQSADSLRNSETFKRVFRSLVQQTLLYIKIEKFLQREIMPGREVFQLSFRNHKLTLESNCTSEFITYFECLSIPKEFPAAMTASISLWSKSSWFLICKCCTLTKCVEHFLNHAWVSNQKVFYSNGMMLNSWTADWFIENPLHTLQKNMQIS